MRSQGIHRTSGVVLSVLASLASSGLVFALAVGVAACTVSTVRPLSATATATPALTPTLTCAYTLIPLPILQDQPTTVPFVGEEAEFLCLVTGAPRTETSFTLTVVILTGQQSASSAPPAPPCVGTLQQGRGACAHTYFLLVGPPPLSPTGTPITSYVSGVLHPSGHRLGPVVPILATSD